VTSVTRVDGNGNYPIPNVIIPWQGLAASFGRGWCDPRWGGEPLGDGYMGVRMNTIPLKRRAVRKLIKLAASKRRAVRKLIKLAASKRRAVRKLIKLAASKRRAIRKLIKLLWCASCFRKKCCFYAARPPPGYPQYMKIHMFSSEHSQPKKTPAGAGAQCSMATAIHMEPGETKPGPP
jgi:hypothetical protein